MADKAPDVRVTHIEDDGVTFPVFSLVDIEQFEQWIKRELISHYCLLADATTITQPERFAFLKAEVPEAVDIRDLFAYAQTARGIRYILTKSIGEKPEIIEKYGGTNGANLAMAILGFAKRQTPAEIDARMLELSDRLTKLHEAEQQYQARKAALEAAENGVEPEAAESKPFPPGGGRASE